MCPPGNPQEVTGHTCLRAVLNPVSSAMWPPDLAPGTGPECRQVKFSPFTGNEGLLGLGICAQSITSCFSSCINPGRSSASAQTCWWFTDLTTWMLARVDNTWAVPTHPGTLTASFQGKDIFPPSRAFPSSLAEDGILLARVSCIPC